MQHIELTTLGYKKRDLENCDLGDAYTLLQMVHSEILPQAAKAALR